MFAPGQALVQDDARPTCRAHLPETLQIAGLQWLFNGENLALQSAEVGDALINGAPKVVRIQAHPGRVGPAVEEGRHLARVPAGVAGHLDLEIIETQPAVTGQLPAIGKPGPVPQHRGIGERAFEARRLQQVLHRDAPRFAEQIQQSQLHGAKSRRVAVYEGPARLGPGAQAVFIRHFRHQGLGVPPDERRAAGHGLAGHIVPGATLAVARVPGVRTGDDDQVFRRCAPGRGMANDGSERHREGERLQGLHPHSLQAPPATASKSKAHSRAY